jgi:hypothetical protein
MAKEISGIINRVLEEIPDIVDTFSDSRWDGSLKDYTKECSGCGYYRFMDYRNTCYWGVAWKILVKPKKMKKCEFTHKPSPRLEEMKKHNEFVRGWRESIKNPPKPTRISDYDPVFGRFERYIHI